MIIISFFFDGIIFWCVWWMECVDIRERNLINIVLLCRFLSFFKIFVILVLFLFCLCVGILGMILRSKFYKMLIWVCMLCVDWWRSNMGIRKWLNFLWTSSSTLSRLLLCIWIWNVKCCLCILFEFVVMLCLIICGKIWNMCVLWDISRLVRRLSGARRTCISFWVSRKSSVCISNFW